MSAIDDRAGVIQALVDHGVVPVVRTPSAGLAAHAVDWLGEAGLRTFEITMTIPDAIALIEDLASDNSRIVGAGTVLDAAQAGACIAAGARYVVSPALCGDVLAPCREAGVACILGAATPSEVVAAAKLGCDAIKIFPVASLGGAAHVKALKAVFPRLTLAPTGGIGVDEIGAYLRAGSAFVGVGGRLVDVDALAKGERAAIVAAGRAALEQVRAARVQIADP